MASVFDVAQYILACLGPTSTLKLQKLIYYCQVKYIQKTRNFLFFEDFEAWVNGPVVRELYQCHRGMLQVRTSELPGDWQKLDPYDRSCIDEVLKEKGGMYPFDLVEMTHKELPWIDARQGCAPGQNSCNVITKESLLHYYGR